MGIWGNVSRWLGWFGVVAGAASAISAFSRIFHVGFAPVLADFVTFYRDLLKPVRDFINALPLPFDVSLLQLDLIALYLVLFGLSYRTQLGVTRVVAVDYLWNLVERLTPIKKPVHALPLEVRRGLNILLAGLYVGLLCPIWRLSPVKWLGAVREAEKLEIESGGDGREYAAFRGQFRSVLLQMVSLPLIVIVFFVLNAYGPT